VKADEGEVVAAIEQILLHFPFYGYRKLHKELARRGITVGEHRVRRLLRQLGMTRSVGKVRMQTTDSHHPHPRYPNRIGGLNISRPDQVWVADITYIRLGRRFIYLAVILDAHTRAVRGWALSRSLEQQLTLDALDMALAKGTPFIFHSDQGSQYAAWQHTDRLLGLGVKISMSDKASPTQNGLVERFMRTVKQEHVDYSEYRGFEDAEQQLKHWLEVVYMTERIHEALDYVTPAEFEVFALAGRYTLLNPA
jgi:transposase InsO family protein